jgi:hypothetical protein
MTCPAHVNKGVACITCHGPVNRMDLMWKEASMKMEWCLDCHRHPERYVGPREAVFLTDWSPPHDEPDLGMRLVKEYEIAPRTDCNTCHR